MPLWARVVGKVACDVLPCRYVPDCRLTAPYAHYVSPQSIYTQRGAHSAGSDSGVGLQVPL